MRIAVRAGTKLTGLVVCRTNTDKKKGLCPIYNSFATVIMQHMKNVQSAMKLMGNVDNGCTQKCEEGD
jgi:hypothetical protein